MRQVDGSDLLGQNDPRNADIGILYVEPEDSRQEILTAINAQELLGRKQIAIVLPEQGKAFRQPVEFDGLKNMRRGLKAQLIFIAPSGPGPAEFARHRRFNVYSSLETFKTALLSERALNPRAKSPAGEEKKPGLLGRGRANKERGQNGPPVQPVTPPTPRIMPAASVQPVMPPTPPTPRIMSAQSSEPESKVGAPMSPIPPTPIEEMDTQVPDFENSPAGPVGIGMAALTASALGEDDDLAPPVTPRQPQGGVQGSATPGSPAGGGPRTSDARRSPTPLLLTQQTNTPRPGGSGKLPAASAQGSQTRTGSGKQPAISGRPGSTQGQRRSSKQLAAAEGTAEVSDTPEKPNGKNSSTAKLPVVLPLGVMPMGPAAASGVNPAPASASAASTTVAAPGGSSASQRQVALTPLPPPVSQRHRRSRGRKRLLLLLLLLTLLLAGGIAVSALGGISGLASIGRLSATVTITPRSQTVQNNYLISGVTTTPDSAHRQVSARVLTAQSDTQQRTGNATGSIPATQATGPLLFFNGTGSGLTIAGNKTILNAANGVQVTFSGTVFVPATGSGEATVNNAYVIESGAKGNIPALAIAEPCCVAGITVKNPSAFTGGQDAQPNSVIQQSDIDGAAQPLITQLTASTKAALQHQVKSNERVVDGSQQCPPTVHADHNAGDHAPSVTVSVSVSCTEEVFDLAAAQQIASSLLPTNLPNGTNLTDYQLVPPIITSLVSASVVSAQGQVNIQMQAAGKWVYQFSSQQLQQIRQGLAGHSKADAQHLLNQYVGLASASISISSGSTMPTDPNAITVTIVPVSGLPQNTPTGTGTGTPPVVPSPSGSVAPCPSPTSALSGGPCG